MDTQDPKNTQVPDAVDLESTLSQLNAADTEPLDALLGGISKEDLAFAKDELPLNRAYDQGRRDALRQQYFLFLTRRKPVSALSPELALLVLSAHQQVKRSAETAQNPYATQHDHSSAAKDKALLSDLEAGGVVWPNRHK